MEGTSPVEMLEHHGNTLFTSMINVRKRRKTPPPSNIDELKQKFDSKTKYRASMYPQNYLHSQKYIPAFVPRMRERSSKQRSVTPKVKKRMGLEMQSALEIKKFVTQDRCKDCDRIRWLWEQRPVKDHFVVKIRRKVARSRRRQRSLSPQVSDFVINRMTPSPQPRYQQNRPSSGVKSGIELPSEGLEPRTWKSVQSKKVAKLNLNFASEYATIMRSKTPQLQRRMIQLRRPNREAPTSVTPDLTVTKYE